VGGLRRSSGDAIGVASRTSAHRKQCDPCPAWPTTTFSGVTVGNAASTGLHCHLTSTYFVMLNEVKHLIVITLRLH
jgi:hypothetical protein